MVRGGRRVVVAVAAAGLLWGMGGCARFDDRPVDVAASTHDGGCVVGTWKQTEGWQRLVTDTLVTDLMLIDGGRQFEVKADGSASFSYTDPTKWESPGYSSKLEVVYAGTVTLTYKVEDGNWTETANASKATTQITLNGETDPPVPGAASRVTKATFVCGESDLILTGDGFRQAFKRA
jgi:hypothetical protein